jgi:hypothetical protein
LRGKNPVRQTSDDGKAVGGDVVQHQLDVGQEVAAASESFDEFRRVSAATADHGDLHGLHRPSAT